MGFSKLAAGLALCAGCAAGPTAKGDETLSRLRAALAEPVADEAQNRAHSALAEEVTEERYLHRLTRQEVEARIGKGDRCANHPICAEKGFDQEDWFYEVGALGSTYMRVRPVLIVGFGRMGTVERTYNLRPE